MKGKSSVRGVFSPQQVQFFDKFCQGFVEGIFIVDPYDWTIVSANHEAAKHLHTDLAYLVGSDVLEWMNSPEDAFFWEEVAQGKHQNLYSDTILQTKSQQTIEVERKITYINTPDVSLYLVVFYNQSPQRQIEHELETLVAELRATFESIAEGILVTDLKGTIRSYNQYFARIWNLPLELLTSRDDREVYQWIQKSITNQEDYLRTQEHLRRDPLHEGVDVLYLADGKIIERTIIGQYTRGQAIGRICSYKDVTQHTEDADRLRLAATVFESSLDAVMIANPDFEIVSINPSAQALFNKDERVTAGQPLLKLFVRDGKEFSPPVLKEILHNQGHWTGQVTYFNPHGKGVHGHINLVRVQDAYQELSHVVLFFKDISEKLDAQHRIEELAYTDMLTGLPNRLRLMERLDYMLPLARRRQETFGVVFLDLDRFKNINDTLGHQYGDRVLVEISQRLKLCVREVDMVARLGGDEFVLLLNQTDHSGIEIVLNRVMQQLLRPVEIEDFSFSLSCSMGVAMYPNDGHTSDELIKNADTAMYRVKDNGREGYRFYQPQMNMDMLAKLKLEQAMREALKNYTFQLYYQPQYDVYSEAIVGYEALIRWKDPDGRFISPGVFIPVAEETGFIVTLGQWILNEGIEQAAKWYREGHHYKVSINVSAIQFRQSNFVEIVQRLLLDHGLPSQYLELELTESVLVKDTNEVLLKLQALSDLGVSLGIDDFGTGYSSLGYLKTFPIHRLKIDRSFVHDIVLDNKNRGIVHAIITLGQSLGLKVVAEGVETKEQLDILKQLGCPQGQGFFWSAAVPPEDVKYLEQRSLGSLESE